MQRLHDSPRPDPALKREILAILAKETAIEPSRLEDHARIDELGIASIDLMQTIFAIETRFDVEIPLIAQNTHAEFATVGDLISHAMAAIEAGAHHPSGGGG